MFDDFFLCLENERVGAGDHSTEQTKSGVVDVGDVRGVFEVRAKHREVLGVFHMAEAVQLIDAFFDEGICEYDPVCVEG